MKKPKVRRSWSRNPKTQVRQNKKIKKLEALLKREKELSVMRKDSSWDYYSID